MAKYIISDSQLEVLLSPLEQLSTLRRSFNVPIENIRGATADPGAVPAELGIRAPGTGFPSFIAAGTFYKRFERQFVCWLRGQTPVVVELTGHKFARLILGSESPRELADAINQKLGSR